MLFHFLRNMCVVQMMQVNIIRQIDDCICVSKVLPIQ